MHYKASVKTSKHITDDVSGLFATQSDRSSELFEAGETSVQKEDLVALEKKGLPPRDFNSEACSLGTRHNVYLFENPRVQERQEKAIAELALNYVTEGFTILLDAGSATLALARALQGKFHALFIITNSIQVALELSKTDYEVLLIGGEVRKDNLALVGSAATKTLKRYHADRAFLETSGITISHGYSTADPLDAQVKHAMMLSADETYVLADSSKFGRAYLESFASLSAISLALTDSGIPAKFREAFAERGIGFKCA